MRLAAETETSRRNRFPARSPSRLRWIRRSIPRRRPGIPRRRTSIPGVGPRRGYRNPRRRAGRRSSRSRRLTWSAVGSHSAAVMFVKSSPEGSRIGRNFVGDGAGMSVVMVREGGCYLVSDWGFSLFSLDINMTPLYCIWLRIVQYVFFFFFFFFV